MAIFYASSTERQLRIEPIISLLCVIKVTHPDVYARLAIRDITYDDLVAKLSVLDLNSDNKMSRRIEFIMSWFNFALMSDKELIEIEENSRIHRYGDALWRYNIEREQLIPFFIERLNLISVV